MIITQPLEITTTDGRPTGRWRLVQMSDEHDGADPLCDCGGRASDSPTACGHESPAAATECPVASAAVLARRQAESASRRRPLLAYGSDGRGGLDLHLGDEHIHLTGDEVQALVREAARPAGVGSGCR